jgi:hypothetical protein
MPAPRLQLQLTTPYQNVCSIVKDQATERPNAGFSGVTAGRTRGRGLGREGLETGGPGDRRAWK